MRLSDARAALDADAAGAAVRGGRPRCAGKAGTAARGACAGSGASDKLVLCCQPAQRLGKLRFFSLSGPARRTRCFCGNSRRSVRALPEQLFLNYVLHPRVNEEELCDCRGVFYAQLAERIQGLSAREAILAVNAWNAEQVCYRATDGRTISALGAQRSGFGRCGEESTFAVNALRAVGIPARQVYTPRWAHCDDNHAWVEAFCDGAWHYLGACEPEPELDRGWFTGAASRALLVHSRCFGQTRAGR